jgi:redox-sensing transcriptional repressor
MIKFPDDTISVRAIRRLPAYYNYLRELRDQKAEYVSSATIARAMGLSEVQARKDLAAVSSVPGTPRKGFLVRDLLAGIEDCLGYNNCKDALLVGAGQLGKALLLYKGFEEHGMRIVAAFDIDPLVIGANVGGKQILAMAKLPSLRERLGIRIGVITVPGAAAQEVCDTLVASGISAIWNFAPVHLKIPEGILAQNENLAASLALLGRQLSVAGRGGGDTD